MAASSRYEPLNIKTIIEPFRIRSVEPIRSSTLEEREEALAKAGYNPFLLPADSVLIDRCANADGVDVFLSEERSEAPEAEDLDAP